MEQREGHDGRGRSCRDFVILTGFKTLSGFSSTTRKFRQGGMPPCYGAGFNPWKAPSPAAPKSRRDDTLLTVCFSLRTGQHPYALFGVASRYVEAKSEAHASPQSGFASRRPAFNCGVAGRYAERSDAMCRRRATRCIDDGRRDVSTTGDAMCRRRATRYVDAGRRDVSTQGDAMCRRRATRYVDDAPRMESPFSGVWQPLKTNARK
jgi:hypothetical protein